MDVVIVGLLTLAGFVSVGLMAYLAVRKEKPGPTCPRCLNRVRPADRVCRSCRLRLA